MDVGAYKLVTGLNVPKNREQMKLVIEEQRVIGLVLVEKRLNPDETYPSQ